MRLKTIIAIVLIIASLAGIYYWESTGREKLLMSEVLVAAHDIPSGKIIDLTDLTSVSLPSSSLSVQSLSISDAGGLVGMRSVVSIPENMQLASSYFTSAGQEFTRGQSIYVIPDSWICGASSSLRAGDIVSIFLIPEFRYMGQFEVAFVKDDSSSEVLNEGTDTALERSAQPDVGKVEIICSLMEYKRLYNAIEGNTLPEIANIPAIENTYNSSSGYEDYSSNVNEEDSSPGYEAYSFNANEEHYSPGDPVKNSLLLVQEMGL